MTPESQRRMVASIAANARWATEPDRTAATQKARDGRLAKFERQVDPNGELTPTERRTRALAARRADMKRLALRSAQRRAAA